MSMSITQKSHKTNRQDEKYQVVRESTLLFQDVL